MDVPPDIDIWIMPIIASAIGMSGMIVHAISQQAQDFYMAFSNSKFNN
jgi:paraquat-inducible protein B